MAPTPHRSTRSWRCCERGGVVVLPTDTVYGLAALPTSARAVERVFALKGRRADVPIAVLCATAEQALALGRAGAGRGARWPTRFWPGPLTLVLPRRAGLDAPPRRARAHHRSAGARPRSRARGRRARPGPIAATSANRHGEPTAATAAEAAASLDGAPDLVVDGGPLDAAASTVVDATTSPWTALRHGPIDPAEVIAAGIG